MWGREGWGILSKVACLDLGIFVLVEILHVMEKREYFLQATKVRSLVV
jgi:hypothetical protein